MLLTAVKSVDYGRGRADHGREQLAISVAKINYNREINKVSLLLLGIRAACSLCRGNKKGKSFLYLVR